MNCIMCGEEIDENNAKEYNKVSSVDLGHDDYDEEYAHVDCIEASKADVDTMRDYHRSVL